jgi:xanthine dehydrogenase YagS FAD-binding subunit
MKAFEYAAPATAAQAVESLSGPESVALSGGTDLLGRMKDYVTNPDRVVYLKDIKALSGVEPAADGSVTIGAGTLLSSLLANKAISDKYPALWQATLEVGTPQIKNMATVGGNLLQRPRCWYFRAGYGLLPKQDGKNLVREGDNRYHAIFLNDGDALFVSPSSLAVPLVALGARATILGAKGERTVPVESLYQIPKKDGDRELTIAPGELLTTVTIPPPRGKNASYEVRQKQAHDWPLVLASVDLAYDGDKVKDARIVLYGVAPVPYRCEAAERAIAGKPVTIETASAAGKAAIEGAKPLSKNGYKVALTNTVVKRALLTAEGKRYWEEG